MPHKNTFAEVIQTQFSVYAKCICFGILTSCMLISNLTNSLIYSTSHKYAELYLKVRITDTIVREFYAKEGFHTFPFWRLCSQDIVKSLINCVMGISEEQSIKRRTQ
jgi:hypothetical protein